MIGIAKGIAGRGLFESDRRGDVAGVTGLNVLTMVGMHLQDAAHALGMTLGGIEHRGTGVDRARIDAEEAELAHKGVGGNLKGQSREGLRIRRMPLQLLFGVRIDALDGRNVGGGGHVVDDRIEQLLHALVFIRGAASYRDHFVGQSSLADAGFDLIDGKLFPVEILLQQFIVLLGDMLKQRGVVFLRLILHIGGDFFLADILAQIIVVNISLHINQIDDPAEILFRTDGQLDGDGVAFQPVQHHVNDMIEVGAHNVHLIDIGHTGHLVFIGLTPHRLGLGLHAALGAKHRDRTVENTQRTLDLHGKVNVARGVDDVQTVILPEASRGGRGDGDASLLLLLHPVHRRGALVGLADFMVDASVVQNALCGGGLTGVNMSHNTNVSS